MRIEQRQWTREKGWSVTRKPADFDDAPPSASAEFTPQLVLYFASEAGLAEAASALPAMYPSARLLGCSTAGEICGVQVSDDSVVSTAIQFQHTTIKTAYRAVADASDSEAIGKLIASDLDPCGLVHAFVLAEGLRVNGSELVKGLCGALPGSIAVTGGMAADAERFQHTTVRLDDRACDGGIAIVGFYGDRLRVGYGSMGGWDQFGPDRLVTRSEGNVLFELDGRSALELYRTYLGAYAADLPASGMRFPLSIKSLYSDTRVVRMILGIDEDEGSLTFAGDIPEGSYTRLMKANVDRLIDGALGAANASYDALGQVSPELAILISSVGRKGVLRQRVEEEIENVRDVLSGTAAMSGFYSYGEIAPSASNAKCELHNQTMTITSFIEF